MKKQSLIIFIAKNNERRTAMITISILANFLSINSSEIEEFDVATTDNGDVILIKLKKKECCCPYCRSSSLRFKEYRNRKIKHALFLGRKTIFVLRSRKYRCLECSKAFMEPNNFAPKRSRASYETIRVVLESSQFYNNTWKEVGERAHISDTATIDVFDRFVNLSRNTLPRVLSIDECYNKHQFNKPYSCIFFDFLNNKIVDIIEDRSKHNLFTYLNKITKEERENVEYVVIDMWEPYLDIATLFFPKAIVAIDSFHVIKEIGFALDKVRRRIMNGCPKGSTEYYLLKKWNYTLFKEYRLWDEKFKVKGLGNKWYNLYQIQKMIIDIHPDLEVAQDFYSYYKRMNQITGYESATKMLDSMINNKEIIKLNEFIPVIQMLSNWKEWIANSFIVVDGRRLSNGPIEGFNSNFKKMMTVSNGLYSFQRFRNRLMYCYNKPNILSPVKERISKRPRKKRGPYKKARNLTNPS